MSGITASTKMSGTNNATPKRSEGFPCLRALAAPLLFFAIEKYSFHVDYFNDLFICF